MVYLLLAVVSASLLGSLHCIGMCGPLAILASQGNSSQPNGRMFKRVVMYHLGRLTTYLSFGATAGYLGSLVNFGNVALGWQVTAARVAGVLMIAVGVAKIIPLVGFWKTQSKLQPSRIASILVGLRPRLVAFSPTIRAYAIGLLTTLLPCGWLYLFALAAAGTGSEIMGSLLMFAFWIGSLPALTSLVAGTRWLTGYSLRLVPVATAILLILTGCFTATGRGFAELKSLKDLQPTAFRAETNGFQTHTEILVEQIQNSDQSKLPCCQAHVGDTTR